MKRTLLSLLLCSCGVGAPSVPGPEVTVEASPPQASTSVPPSSQCVPEDVSNGLWDCDTIAALELLDLRVVSWPAGQSPQLRVTVRNHTSRFLNYPGVRIESSAGGGGIEQRYGMWACGVEEMNVQVDSVSAPPGQAVTFTAVASAIVAGPPCSRPAATLSVGFTAP